LSKLPRNSWNTYGTQDDLLKYLSVSLVLVHGLNGDPVESWTHDKTKICWPRDLLHQKLPQTRVFSFGYDADIEGNSSVAGIRGNARALLGRLRDHREDLKSRNPIVFLAHSLGGLIVKQVPKQLSP